MSSPRVARGAALAAVDGLGAVPDLSDAEFASLRAMILEHSGIQLNDSKRALLYARLVRRIRELGMGTFAEYEARARGDATELRLLLDRVTTNETSFFREPRHFDYLARSHLPQLIVAATAGQRPRTLRAWSAGCSTGEEPYSLAMTLLDALPPDAGWSVQVLATDLSTRVLDAAARATWPIERTREIPGASLRRYMLRGTGSQQGFIRATPELRSCVAVRRLNLDAEDYPAEPFDLVFCRNVLIYFQPERRDRVLRRLIAGLVTDGLLFVGHAESVRSSVDGVRCVAPTIYVRSSRRPS